MKVNTPLWTEQDHVVVAVSCGVDSMCLLHYLLYEGRDSYRQLTCLHVNHGLRQEADEEEAFLIEYCKRHHIALYTHHLNMNDNRQDNNIEQLAREGRYQWFDRMVKACGGDVLLTAHHQDDQIETIFYRLFTGRSTRNSLGIADIQERQGYLLARPLLDTTKDEIRRYQATNNIPYFEDKSNASNDYVRNDIRNRILPFIEKNEQLESSQLLRLKRWHDEEMDQIQRSAHHFIHRSTYVELLPSKIKIDRSEFNHLNFNLKVSVLDQLFAMEGKHEAISEKLYSEVFKQLSSETAQTDITISAQWIIRIAYDKFILMARTGITPRTTAQSVSKPGVYHFNHYRINIHQTFPEHLFPLVIRLRKNGDKIKLNHRSGHKKVSRLFIDHKVMRGEREHIPLIECADKQIIAVGSLYTHAKYINDIDIKDLGEE